MAEAEVEAGATTKTVVVTCVCGAAVDVGVELTVTVAVTVSVTTLRLAGELEAAAFAAVAAALEETVVAFAFEADVVDDFAIVEIEGADVDSAVDDEVAAEPEVSCWTTTQLPKPAVLVNEARQRSLLVPPVHCVSEGIWTIRFSDPVLDGSYKARHRVIIFPKEIK